MTSTEFSNEFDILFNSIATNAAPDIDLYEKSVYLTDAQEILIKQYFNPKGNKYQEGFENSSKRRNDLSQLVKPYKSVFSETINNNFKNFGITKDSKFFKIPKNTFLIVQERADILLEGNTDLDLSNLIDVTVVPTTHDEINIELGNPFKNPNKKRVARLEFSSEGLDYNIVELINPFRILNYRFRYVKYPDPIILTNLDSSFPGENLSINNRNQETLCKLNYGIQREILKLAVKLATADYKPELYKIKSQINQTSK
jgi:hypothetical protein